MNRNTSRAATVFVFTIAATLLFASLPGVATAASAARAKPQKPVSTAHAKKLQNRSIERKTRNLKNLTKRIDGMVALVKDMQQRNVTDMMADNQTRARLHDLAKRQANLKRDLVKLKEQSVQQYAASRGIPLIPAPPTTAPPPLPSTPAPSTNLLSVPQQTTLPVNSFLPPGGAAKLTIDPQI
jgi:Na+/phosphate symporter